MASHMIATDIPRRQPTGVDGTPWVNPRGTIFPACLIFRRIQVAPPPIRSTTSFFTQQDRSLAPWRSLLDSCPFMRRRQVFDPSSADDRPPCLIASRLEPSCVGGTIARLVSLQRPSFILQQTLRPGLSRSRTNARSPSGLLSTRISRLALPFPASLEVGRKKPTRLSPLRCPTTGKPVVSGVAVIATSTRRTRVSAPAWTEVATVVWSATRTPALAPRLSPSRMSLVDGFNLPMRITNNKGCPVTDCPADLNPNCPAELKGPFNSTGFPVGCNSACSAGLGDPVNNPNCCTGTHNTAATCPPSGVQYYSYFKGNCPNAYVYAYDDSGNTPLRTCNSNLAADYTITFCP